jgi:dGTPase
MALKGPIFEPPAARAAFACRPADSRGRRYEEPESPTRTAFQRDRDRILHSAAFRRLKHKTQVFVFHEGDHYRTRLTHSLEVAQIARSICRVLGLDEDLAEALALAHDLGHTPFGHAGEDALDACMAPFGGFDHNAQTLRIVTALEQRYAAFDGLNLTWETLEGIAKHNGPVDAERLPWALADYGPVRELELDTWPGAEAQVAALSDDIAYDNHDIDDGLRAHLFDVEELYALPLVGPVFLDVLETFPGIDRSRHIHEAVRRLIGLMIGDVIAETRRRIAAARPDSADAVRRLGRPLVGFSEEMARDERALKQFLHARMYRHYKVGRTMSQARRVVRELFVLFVAEPELLPPEWGAACEGPGSRVTARVVSDFIAGMTDRFAIEEHRRLFDLTLSPP